MTPSAAASRKPSPESDLSSARAPPWSSRARVPRNPAGRAANRHRRSEPLCAVGNGEGQLNIIAWAGYAEDGSNDKAVDWVTPFEQKTGCQVNVKLGNTSDEMIQLMRTGQYDGVSASGDATLRLIYAWRRRPGQYRSGAQLRDDLAVPEGRAVEFGERADVWRPARLGRKPVDVQHRHRRATPPNSWGAVFTGAGKYKGKVTAYDSPIYIADAALYLSKTKPELGIKDPYSLTSEQLDAAIELLKEQRENVSEYWSDYTKEVQAFESGTSVIGTTWQVIANTIGGENKVQVNTMHRRRRAPPVGPTPGWSRRRPRIPTACTSGWTGSPRPRSMLRWPNTSARHPRRRRPANIPRRRTSATSIHATDADYAEQIHYWTTPQNAVRRRQRRQLHGLRRVGRQVAADQGVTRAAPISVSIRRRIGLAFLLVPPMAWLVVAYLGSLAVLLVSAFWSTNSFTGAVVRQLHHRELRPGVHRRGVPNGHGAHHRRLRCWSRSSASCSRCRWRYTWPRWPLRGSACCW